jgi:pimeloyl-ACP methyl ester carboxylesterase
VAHSLGCAITSFAIADGLPVPARLGFVAPTVGPVAHISSTIRLLGASHRTERAMIGRISAIVGRPITDFDSTALSGPRPPTLIVHDRLDKEVPHDEAIRIAQAWPDVDLHSTTGLGHRRILRDVAVLDRVADFVAG